MWILILFLIFTAMVGIFTGYQTWFKLEKLTGRIILNTIVIILGIFTLLMIAYSIGYFHQEIAAPFMMVIYSMLAGFFAGYAYRMFSARANSGSILYQNRSFLVDHAPNFFAMALILFGIYRTGILTEIPITGIRATSGISIICFGILGLTVKVVPELRTKGIMFLDRFIHWKHIVAWQWASEDVIVIEYLAETGSPDEIRHFMTKIPEDERKQAESILRMKMDEFAEERSEALMPDDDQHSGNN